MSADIIIFFLPNILHALPPRPTKKKHHLFAQELEKFSQKRYTLICIWQA
jgi:hypothetical protein